MQSDAEPYSTPEAIRSLIVPSGSAYTVDTPSFRLVLPSEPTVNQVNDEVGGVRVAGTAWTIDESDSSGSFLKVMAAEYMTGTDIVDGAFEARFDSVISGMVGRSNGAVVSQEPLTVSGGVARRVIIDGGDLQFSLYLYAKGSWVVVIAGAADEPDPAALLAVVQSFTFK